VIAVFIFLIPFFIITVCQRIRLLKRMQLKKTSTSSSVQQPVLLSSCTCRHHVDVSWNMYGSEIQHLHMLLAVEARPADRLRAACAQCRGIGRASAGGGGGGMVRGTW